MVLVAQVVRDILRWVVLGLTLCFPLLHLMGAVEAGFILTPLLLGVLAVERVMEAPEELLALLATRPLQALRRGIPVEMPGRIPAAVAEAGGPLHPGGMAGHLLLALEGRVLHTLLLGKPMLAAAEEDIVGVEQQVVLVAGGPVEQ